MNVLKVNQKVLKLGPNTRRIWEAIC